MSGIPAAVFLDRDGTIIEDVHYIKSPEQVRTIPGAPTAIGRLNRAGIAVIVVTNQSGIARGLLTADDYEAVRAHLDALLADAGAHIDESYYCPHHPDVTGPCDCRKPATKLFEDAMRHFALQPDEVAYIGDRWRDVAPARALGGRGILIPSAMTTASDLQKAAADSAQIAPTLGTAVEMLLGLTSPVATR
ncbi:MAG TPA: HAD family hydrolase [Gemmatimonadaceae bacterium]|nr:HAD family hydrolase [Gemmatimonadaceae bacterium]